MNRYARNILYIHPASDRRHHIATSSSIGWMHTQNDPWIWSHDAFLLWGTYGRVQNSAVILYFNLSNNWCFFAILQLLLWQQSRYHLIPLKSLQRLRLIWRSILKLPITQTRLLTHWGRVIHICICVGNLTIIGSHNGLSPGRRQAIIWTNAGILLIGHLGTNFNENLIEIIFSFKKKMRLKVPYAKWRPFCLSLNLLRRFPPFTYQVPHGGINSSRIFQSSYPQHQCTPSRHLLSINLKKGP